jgi:hypothetical protein
MNKQEVYIRKAEELARAALNAEAAGKYKSGSIIAKVAMVYAQLAEATK